MADFFSKFKRKTRGSSSGSSDNDSYTTREKRFCDSLGEDIIPTEEVDEVVLALDMSSEVASTLHQVLEKLKIMEKKVDGVLEKVTGLECTMKTVQEDISTLKGRTSGIEKAVKDMDDGLNFMNSGVENLKCKVESSERETKFLKERLLYQEVYNRRENLRFIGIPENEEVNEENTSETVYRFMERELNIEGARHIEFQRVHRIGAKKPGNSRPIIACFLKYPDRARVFKRALERRGHIDVKIYSDLPREIQEGRKKQWPLLKRAREEGKTAFFSKKEPDKLFIEGRLSTT